MFEFTVPSLSALDTLEMLSELRAEQALARAAGHATEAAELDADIEASTHAFVGAAVTEIATFRAELEAPLQG
jgi:hypothetical protein